MAIKGEEKDAGFYDAKLRDVGHWVRHYSQSPYYPVWTVIADRLRASGRQTVIDIGCGPGQFAALLADNGIGEYLGLDLSPAMVKQAQRACPAAQFLVADIHASDALETQVYDCAVMLEFLEHVEEDLSVLERVRPGTLFLGTVPNYPARSHVRHFRNADEVRERYGKVLSGLEIHPVRMNERGSTLFVMQGVR